VVTGGLRVGEKRASMHARTGPSHLPLTISKPPECPNLSRMGYIHTRIFGSAHLPKRNLTFH